MAADLHALADPLHLARPRHSLGPLVRFLLLPLLVLDAPQQPLHMSSFIAQPTRKPAIATQ